MFKREEEKRVGVGRIETRGHKLRAGMEQRKKVVLKREKRSSGNKERQFRPTFPEHFRLLKLSERRRRRRWQRHRPLRSFSRPAHIVKASSCASPMRDLKRRERGGHSPCNSAPTVAVVPRAKFKSLSSLSLYSLVWLAARDQKILLLTYSSLGRPVFISLGICSQNRNSTFVQGQVSP